MKAPSQMLLDSAKRRLWDTAIMMAQTASAAGCWPEDEVYARTVESRKNELERAALDYAVLVMRSKETESKP
jgi:hypothetical protein